MYYHKNLIWRKISSKLSYNNPEYCKFILIFHKSEAFVMFNNQ